MVNDLEKSLRNSIIDGVYAQSMSTLTAGLFLTGFVMALGGNSSHIGAASAVPLVTNVFQLFASYLIEKTGRRKSICINACLIARGLWIAFAAIPLIYMWGGVSGENLIWTSVLFYFLISVASAFAGISWLSWMKDLVPPERRGKYFGLRSAFTSAAGLIVGLAFGRFLDVMKGYGENYYLCGFFILFMTAFGFGMASTYYLKKVEEPDLPASVDARSIWSFLSMLSLPFKNRNFRKVMYINILWTFFCQMGSPFFNLFMLRDLKISFTMMAVYDVVNLVANISMFSVWGRLSDHFGNKSILLITTFFGALLPLIMVFANISNAGVLVPLFEFTTGLMWSGISLSTSNIFLKLAPSEHGSVYLSLNSALNGLIASVGPVLGGFMAYQMKDTKLVIDFGYSWLPAASGLRFSQTIINLQFIFIISVILRLVSAYLFVYVEEPESRPFKNLARVLTHGRGFAPTMLFASIYESVSSGLEQRIGKIEHGVVDRVRHIRQNVFKGDGALAQREKPLAENEVKENAKSVPKVFEAGKKEDREYKQDKESDGKAGNGEAAMGSKPVKENNKDDKNPSGNNGGEGKL
ncbi:MAG TPA: MFS transporter [Candidatus Wallbacteria bacterium]|nr:MFS transporter [Candidatus Wallbacteria bacterium]